MLSGKLASAIDAARETMEQAQRTLALDEGVPGQIAGSVISASDAARSAFAMDRGVPKQLATSLISAADAATLALAQAKDTLAAVEDAIGENSPLRGQVMITIQQLTSAARSIRLMAEYLERHPEALLSGKR